MQAYIFDTETTGFVEPQIIQAASIPVDELGATGMLREQSYSPTKPIELGAKAVHHITETDLENCPPSATFRFTDWCCSNYLIGHNVDYDWEVAGKPKVKRICTLAMARTFWPALDSHSQSALMYLHFGDEATYMLKNAHSAGADVLNLAALWHGMFLPALTQRIGLCPSWEQIWTLSEDCRIPRIMTFGKYKGQSINNVDRGYIQWYLRQPDQDPYVAEAFRRLLKGERL